MKLIKIATIAHHNSGLHLSPTWEDLEPETQLRKIRDMTIALIATAEPSREMLLAGAAAIASPAGGRPTEITYNMAYACWKAMHAAMI